MNKLLLVLIIGVLLFTGYYIFQNNQTVLTEPNPTVMPNQGGSGPSENTNVDQTKITVNYTDLGFETATVTVKKGQTVEWINQSNGDMWVASNPHPTHTEYPEFDQKTTVMSGESFTFTFDQVGTWGYHNHNNPSAKGTIIVQE